MTRILFKAEGLPVLQNRVFATRAQAEASPVGDVVLVQDEATGIVHNAAFDASLLKYDSDYQNEQACSAAFRTHLDEVTQIIGRHFPSRELIEVGCGKGYFLEHLRARGYRVQGVDPAYEGTNPDVIKAPFEASLGVRADGIVLRHVLEHIADPLEFLSQIARANGGRGAIYIEVPCLDWIMQHRAWFDVFYEHVNYFRLADFQRMFGRILGHGRLFGDQYLYVVADLSSLRAPRPSEVERVEFPGAFTAGIDRAAMLVRDHDQRQNAIWGASSKGVIFSTYLQRASASLHTAIDINPAKQGRYLPCTGLEVCAPADAMARLRDGDRIFVMNSNYMSEIRAESHGRYTYLSVDHD